MVLAYQLLLDGLDRLGQNALQAELLAKIVQRGVFILQKKGLMPKFRLDGKEVTVKYTSPFATTQNADDLMSLQKTIQTILSLGPQAGPAGIQAGLKVKDIPAYIARLNGVPESLIMTDDDRKELAQQAGQAAAASNAAQVQQTGAHAAAQAQGEQGAPDQQGGAPPIAAQ